MLPTQWSGAFLQRRLLEKNGTDVTALGIFLKDVLGMAPDTVIQLRWTEAYPPTSPYCLFIEKILADNLSVCGTILVRVLE